MGDVEAGIGVGQRYEFEVGWLVMGLKVTLWMACSLRVRFVQDDNHCGEYW